MSAVGRKRRKKSDGGRAGWEGLERRVLLAGSPFPAPALVGTYDGGWDLATDLKAGSLPSTLDGKTFPPGAFANYTLEIDGQKGVIPLLSVAYGDSTPGVGDPQVSELSLTAPQGKYSTGMLEAVGLRRKSGPMTVHEKDAQGRDHRLWILDDATLTNFSVGGSTGGSAPVTSFSLDFKKITLETIDYTTGGVALPPRMVSFTRSGTGYTGTGTDFGGVTFAAGSEPAQLLDLGTGQVAIDSFSWGVKAGEVSQVGSTLKKGPPIADDFVFTSATGAASLGLYSNVYLKKSIDLVKFTMRDDSGRVVADWILEGAVVSSYGSAGSAGGSAADTFHLRATRVQMVRHVYDALGNPLPSYGTGWDFSLNQPYGLFRSTLAGKSYAPGQPRLAMQIDGASDLIPVDAYGWGEGQAAGGLGVDVGNFAVSIPQGVYSTGMLTETMGNLVVHPEIDLISRDASGREVMRWVLSKVRFDRYATTQVAGGGGPEDVVEVHFSQVKAIYTPPAGKGAAVTASYDTTDMTGTGAAFAGTVYAPGSAPALGLEVGGTTIPVLNYSLGLSRGADRPAGGDKVPPQATPVSITVAQGTWSPGIFASVALGLSYPGAAMVSRDSSGRETARWELGDLQLTGYTTSASFDTADTFTIGYTSIRRVVDVYDSTLGTTKTYSGGYDISTGMPTPPGNTLGSTLAGLKYAAGTEPEYTLSVSGKAGLIPVAQVSWGDRQAPLGSTQPLLDQFSLTIPAGAYETGILEDIGGGKSYEMTLTRRDAQGRPITVYHLTGGKFTLISTQESPGQLVTDQVEVDFQALDVDRLDYAADGSATTTTIRWNVVDGGGYSTDFGGNVFAPGSEPEMVLDLGSGQMAVESFSWGATVGVPSAASDFTVSGPAGAATLGLISSPFRKTAYDQAILTTRDADGRILTQWRLKGVTVSSYFGNGVPGSSTDTASLQFQSIELIYNAYAPAVTVDPVTPNPRNTAVSALTLRFSEPVTGLDLSDLQLTRDGGANLLTGAQTLTSSDGGQTWTLGNLATINGGADGTYRLSVSTSLATAIYGKVTGEPLYSATAGTWVLDRVAPAITAKALDYSVNPNRIRVTFSEDVKSLSKDDLTIKTLTAGAPPTPAFAAFSYDPAAHVAVWTFASPLADGDYRATLAAGSLTDLAGNAIVLTTFDFFSFKGDANHDRSVDFNDLVILAQNYNTSGKTFGQGDLNYDGNVDFNDLVILAQRYNTTLAAPGAAEAAAAPVIARSFAADWASVTAPPTLTASPARRKTKENPIFSVKPVATPRPPAKKSHTVARSKNN